MQKNVILLYYCILYHKIVITHEHAICMSNNNAMSLANRSRHDIMSKVHNKGEMGEGGPG